MVKMTTLNKPLKEHPSLCMDKDDIEIIANHYGYDFAECRVVCGFNDELIGMVGYCLCDDGNVVDDVEGWRTDESLIRKFYDKDVKCGFVDVDTSFKVYFTLIRSVKNVNATANIR